MSELVINRAQAREIDRIAAEVYGLPTIVLMENAGRGAAELLMELGVRGRVIIVAGKGNNGGDGLVTARHLENRGVDLQVLLCCNSGELRGDAATNYRVLEAAGTPLAVLDSQLDPKEIEGHLAGADWVIDALLGTGASGQVREPMKTLIETINQVGVRTLAVDVPSGLDCDTGRPMGCCIRADHSATFVARKSGFDAPGASKWTGRVHVVDIGIPRRLLSDLFS